MYRPRDLAMNVPYRRTAQVRIRWSTGDEDGREENGTPGEDGKIKTTPPSVGLLWSINGLRRLPEKEGWRFSGKSNRINANCATHGVFGCQRPGRPIDVLDRVASI
jgi:hypothetical protein